MKPPVISHSGGQRLDGLIYLHQISDPRMDYMAKKNLEIFSELCGQQNFTNVRIVTTDWGVVDEDEGNKREKALSKRYFKHLIDGGAKMFRHIQGRQSACSIVSELIQQPPVTLKIQEELNAGRALGNTSAGAVIMRAMEEMQKEHDMRMQTLKNDMDRESKDVRDQLEAERRELERQMAKVQDDRKRLEETSIVRQSHIGEKSRLNLPHGKKAGLCPHPLVTIMVVVLAAVGVLVKQAIT